jgi:hypothetical protein
MTPLARAGQTPARHTHLRLSLPRRTAALALLAAVAGATRSQAAATAPAAGPSEGLAPVVASSTADPGAPTAAVVEAQRSAPAPEPEPAPALQALAPRVLLQPMTHHWQTLNNCGPCSVAMVLGHYGMDPGQEPVRQVLRPNPASSGMSPGGLPSYLAQYGLAAPVRINGDLELVRHLLNNGIPVIVSQWLRGEEIGHYRVARGYDDAAGVMVVNDSYLGPNLRFAYAEFVRLWRAYNGRYIPVYPSEKDPLVRAILGDDYVDARMYARAIADAEAAIAAGPAGERDPYNWYKLGEARMGLREYAGAAEAYRAALARRLPAGMFGSLQSRIEQAERQAERAR